MKISAVIFDLDGTVVANEDEWGEAFKKVLKSLGVTVKSRYPHIGGIGIEENWPIFLKKYKINTKKTSFELAQETKRQYQKLISSVDLKKGFEQFVSKLKSQGILTALATSSTLDIVEVIFDKLGIEKYFDSVTTGEEVTYKKPDPQIFEVALDKLGVEPENCIVIEDSEAGIKAAHSLGIKVVGIARDEKHQKKLSAVELIFRDFSEISLQELTKL